MVTVSAFQIANLKLWFWSNDHEPPHFHAKRSGAWEVKVHFLLDDSEILEIVWSEKPPSRKVLQKLLRLSREHRVALLEQWQSLRAQEG